MYIHKKLVFWFGFSKSTESKYSPSCSLVPWACSSEGWAVRPLNPSWCSPCSGHRFAEVASVRLSVHAFCWSGWPKLVWLDSPSEIQPRLLGAKGPSEIQPIVLPVWHLLWCCLMWQKKLLVLVFVALCLGFQMSSCITFDWEMIKCSFS